MQFPDNFVQQTTPLPKDRLSPASQQAVDELGQKGFEVHYGLTIEYADDIATMALEPSIKEYCPKDCAERFKDLNSTQSWLAKKRATFLLLKRANSSKMDLVGYGWAGAAASEHVPTGKTTFAIRIGEAGQGQGLATPFASLIVEASKVLFDASDIWLETWQSNGGAVHVYHKIGFKDVTQIDDLRPTADDNKVGDTRLFMKLP